MPPTGLPLTTVIEITTGFAAAGRATAGRGTATATSAIAAMSALRIESP